MKRIPRETIEPLTRVIRLRDETLERLKKIAEHPNDAISKLLDWAEKQESHL